MSPRDPDNGEFKLKTVREITEIRGQVDGIKTQVEEIKNNHLAHLAIDLKALDTKIEGVDTRLERMENKNATLFAGLKGGWWVIVFLLDLAFQVIRLFK